MFCIAKFDNIIQPAILRDLLALWVQPLDVLHQLGVGDLNLAGQHQVHAGPLGLGALGEDLEVGLAGQA